MSVKHTANGRWSGGDSRIGWGAIFVGMLMAGAACNAQAPQEPAKPPVVQYQWAPAKPASDSPGWNCATMGRHVCAPSNSEHIEPGCYDDGVLVIPWNAMTAKQRTSSLSPCLASRPSQEQESDAAYAAANH